MLKELDDKLDERQLKELQLDIKLTWAELQASLQNLSV